MAEVNFNKTIAPVAKFITIKFIFALQTIMNLKISQMEPKTVF